MKSNVMAPFPVSEHLLCCFAAFLADEGLTSQTGKAYMSVVRSMQISLGMLDPREQSSLPILKRVQAGISWSRILKGSPARIRLPITTHIFYPHFGTRTGDLGQIGEPQQSRGLGHSVHGFQVNAYQLVQASN